MLNSHDGTSAYRLMSGVFRLICLNGLIAGTMYQDVRVGHTGKVTEKVIEGAYTVIDQHKAIESSMGEMQEKVLTDHQARAFAIGATALRYDETVTTNEVVPDSLLRPRRTEDRRQDLWTVFNRVQENTVRGGFTKYSLNKEGRAVSRRQAGPVRNIDGLTAINRGLWAMAEALKSA